MLSNPCAILQGNPKTWAGTARGSGAAFTLVELLVVIGIISILAAIAMPNYQEALTRSKTAKFMGDCKAVETALETYNADYNFYPAEDYYPVGSNMEESDMESTYPAIGFVPRALTTPIGYIGKVPMDPFRNRNPSYNPSQFPERRPCNYSNDMVNTQQNPTSPDAYYVSQVYGMLQGETSRDNRQMSAAIWMINSPGPDGDRDHGWNSRWSDYSEDSPVPDEDNAPTVYDPTNGTTSDGDLFMFGPSLGFPGW
jgi:prepilin-type N-terminal cleavage/methylation domain-containing protein